ncbi:hypothetical protein COV81_03355 [Candidatus Peregrinibacteria bacterium CG11_big_fil_rev_8_21_14_0_20_41_10]|nr:MAG: hypothetical protein COV81_03355 [Candidatus Peregrinibacteria bacterium CG11_big_fil_rev_8_21_14_0_20_41_10]PIZ75794.1 MAG: hypothetical protein COY06_02630 [Candidatus Peregrinibacteria bacterium CG_4_10_14_0_2_um_filter_41_8]PJC38447.1 MAG: hypothetical protein CO045_00375 [Candidatus Peregrinibacteria bacterium CG_4_9_14_0_2_um_filter_41_14]
MILPATHNTEIKLRELLSDIWVLLVRLDFAIKNYHGDRLRQMLEAAKLDEYLRALETALDNPKIASGKEDNGVRGQIITALGHAMCGIDQLNKLR